MLKKLLKLSSIAIVATRVLAVASCVEKNKNDEIGEMSDQKNIKISH
ncbi:hypothetical protein [Mycoplasmopsis gallinacea]|uniref:Lipoprotein n=1 Tax=Mycoplasmopsis gallinacea TaxID=29556 RepID=A0A6H0V0X5_9BACT|nr:hypothetical protein [Mycoplasmopsis gallinacea]QIW61991.1 hypothetical protein GOQ20_00700 [Mycoplasmopsis gallinacea]